MSYSLPRDDSRRRSGSGSSYSPRTSYFPPTRADCYRPSSPTYHPTSYPAYSYDNRSYRPPSPHVSRGIHGHQDFRPSDRAPRARASSYGYNSLPSPSSPSYSRDRRDSQGSPKVWTSLIEPSDAWKTSHPSPHSEISPRSMLGSAPRRSPIQQRRSPPRERDRSIDRRPHYEHRPTESYDYYRPSRSISSESRSPSPRSHRLPGSSPYQERHARRDSFNGTYRSYSPQSARRRSNSRSRGRHETRETVIQRSSSPVYRSLISRSRSRSRSHHQRRSPSVDSIASSKASTQPEIPPLDKSPIIVPPEDPVPVVVRDISIAMSASPMHTQGISPEVFLMEEFLIQSSDFIPPTLTPVEPTPPPPQTPVPEKPIIPRRPHPLGNVAVLPDHVAWEKQVLKSRQSFIDTIPAPPLKAGRESKESWKKQTQSNKRATIKPPMQPHDRRGGEHDISPTEAQTLAHALKSGITVRLVMDRKTREERINPVLDHNSTIVSASHHYDRGEGSSAEGLLKEVAGGAQVHLLNANAPQVQSFLVERLEESEKDQTAHTEHLKEQYVTLRESWKKHCAKLDKETQRRHANVDNPIPHLGRTTRRSAATFAMGDMARSDLEMEQILATLDAEGATDPNQLCLRNVATVPDMVSPVGRANCLHDDDNHRVTNPVEFYAPTSGFEDWTKEEEGIFCAKYALFPKQFGLIADFLPGKTSQQCVDYYYLRKKNLLNFRKILAQLGPNKKKRKGGSKQKGKALLEDIRQHDAAVGLHLDSDAPDNPHMAAPIQMPPLVPGRPRRTKPRTARGDMKKATGTVPFEESSTATATPEPERYPKRKRAPSTAMSPFDSVPRSSSLRPPPSTAGQSDAHSVSTPPVEDEVDRTPSRPPRKRQKRGVLSTPVALSDDEDEDG